MTYVSVLRQHGAKEHVFMTCSAVVLTCVCMYSDDLVL